MRFSRLISLVMVLVLAASLLAPVSAYAAAPGAAFAEAEAPEDSSLPGGDDGQEADPPASEPQNPDPADPGEDSGDVSPAPEAPAEDDSLPAEEGTEPAEDIHEEEEVAPADAPDAPQGELHQMVQAVAGTTATLSLEHSYVLADTLVIPANTTLTLTSKAKLHSALRRRDDAQHQHTGALIRLSPGATLILKNISLMGTSPGHAGHGPLLQVEDKATLRLEAGASLLNNGGSPAISVLAGGAAEMKAGELLDCGIGGYAVANQGSFSFSGGLIWFDGSPAGGGILNQGTLNLSGKAAINAGTTGVLNAGQFTMAGGTLTGPDAFEGWAAGGTGVQNQAGGEFTLTGGTIQRFACGAANSGSMEMGGGAIKDNTATQTDIGAGIHNSGGLHIKGGAITGNKGGAGYAVYTIANLRLSGKPVIGAKAVYGGVYLARAGSAYPLILVESKLAKGSLVVIEDSEQLDRHAVRRLENGSPTTLLAEELGYFACCDGLSTLKQASDDAGIVYKLEKSSLQQTINGKSGGSATAPVVVALGYGTQVGETLVIQNLSGSGTKARHIKLVGGSLVRSPGFGGVMLQVPAGSSLWLEDVEIDGALYGGAAATGALVQNSGTLTLAAGARLHGNALSGAEATAGVVNNATMKMTGGEISGNTGRAIENKKLADGPKPALTISGGEISNNSVIGAGAGVASYKDAAFTMSGGAITGNTAARQPNDYPDLYALGGGVYCRGGFTFKGGLIHKNKATDYGGGIYADSCTLNLNGGRVLENRTFDHDDPSAIGGSGGGIYSYGATVKMTAGAVSGNTGYAGGGLCLMGYSAIMDNDHSVPMGSMTMSGGEVAGNTAEVWGGGISNDNAALILSGGSISGNSAGNLGGGVYNLKDSVYHPGLGSKFSGRRFEMKGGEVSGNTAAYGGGVYSAGTFKHTKGSLTDNTANCGGAVYNLYGNVFSFGSGLMQNNRAVASPAYGSWDDPNVHTRPDNEPLGTGGGVLNFGWIDMTAGTISGNMAEGNGGGIYNRGSLAMTAGSILENSAQKGIDIYAGIGVSVNEQALVRLSGKPKIGTKTAAGGIYFDRSATNNSSGDDHVPHGHIKMPSTLSSGAFIRIAGTAVLEGTGSSDHIIVEKAKGNLTSAEQKMFFCGAMGYQMMLQGEYFKQNNIPGGSNRILVLLPAKNKLQTMVHSATGGTAAKPVVLTLPENTQLSSTLAIQGSKGEARHVTLSGAGLSRGQNFKATMINIPAGSSLTLQNIQLSATATDLATVAVPAVTNSGTLTLKAGATLTGASSSANGAAIRNNAGGTLTIAGGAISGNSSAGLGGAVYNLGRLNMTDGIFTGNTAQGGGAIAGGGVIQLGGGAIEDNQAQNGGGLYLEAGGEAALGAARLAGIGRAHV